MLLSFLAAALLSMGPCATAAVEPSAGGGRVPEGEGPLRTTVYINFNGGELRNAFTQLAIEDNSAEDLSYLIPGSRLTIPPYTGGEQLASAAAQAAEADLAPFGIRVVYLERPPKRLPYTMVMFGGEAASLELELDFSGYAPIDCELATLRHVAFAFNDEATDAAVQGNTISHEAGHTLGLDHALGDDELMSYSGDDNDKEFTDECRDYCTAECLNGAIVCPDRHEEFCPAGQQHAAAELRYAFGDGAPDTQPPQAMFVSPVEGENFRVGAGIRIEAEITDDFGGYGWELRIERDGEVVYDAPDYSGLPQWFLDDARAGAYTLTLTVEDHADHITEETLTFTVGRVDDEDETGGGDTTTGDALPDESSSGDLGESGETDDSGDPDGTLDDDGGCSCRAGGSAYGLLWARAPSCGAAGSLSRWGRPGCRGGLRGGSGLLLPKGDRGRARLRGGGGRGRRPLGRGSARPWRGGRRRG